MKFKIQVVFDDEQGHTQIEDVLRLEKDNDQGYCAGLSLQDAKQLLRVLQEKIVLRQAKA